MTLVDIHLHGGLKKKFGPRYQLEVHTPAEAGRALAAVVPGFRDYCMDKRFRVRLGERVFLNSDELSVRVGSRPLHIFPVVAGAGGRGGKAIGKIIVGALLVATAFTGAGALGAAGAAAGMGGVAVGTAAIGITWGNIAMLGIGIALTGLASLLAPTPKANYQDRERDQRPSFMFDGPINMMAQGHPVPIAYGRVFVGSIVVSAGLQIEQLLSPAGGVYGPYVPSTPPPPPGGGGGGGEDPPPPPPPGRAFDEGFDAGFS